MKRFAQVEDREFEVAGEVFRWKYPFWEDVADQFDQDDITDQEGNVAITVRSTIQDFIERIETFIDEDFNAGVERWRELSKRRKDPIPHSQYSQIYQWLLEVTSQPVPTEQSSPSADGQVPIAATSTGGSS